MSQSIYTRKKQLRHEEMVIPSTMKINRSGSSSSGSGVDLLPHDIMVAILLLVPPRSLLRLKLVCKSWCSLIAHPDFIQLHLDHYSITNKKPPSILISAMNYGAKRQVLYSLNLFDYDDYNNNGVPVLDPVPHSTTAYQSKRYWGSCNGLLCAKIQEKELAVWNPCTHEFHRVPLAKDRVYEAFGFGYDTTTDCYKIIQIKLSYIGAARRRRLIETQVLVYTLGLTAYSSWEALGTVPFEVSPEHEGLFLNGGLHWIATTGCGIGMIICIDIASEEYREISKPGSVSINRDDTMDEEGNVRLISLKGLLCITNCVTDEKSIEVWAMMDYFNGYDEPSSWSKLFTIKEPLMALPNPGLKFFQLMSGICSKDGDEIVALMDTIRSKSLVWYNTKNDKTRTILKDHHHTGFPFLQVQTCIESLVPLNTGSYNLYEIEERREEEKEEEKEEKEEEERQRILRPWKKQKKNTCSCISYYNSFSYCYSH